MGNNLWGRLGNGDLPHPDQFTDTLEMAARRVMDALYHRRTTLGPEAHEALLDLGHLLRPRLRAPSNEGK